MTGKTWIFGLLVCIFALSGTVSAESAASGEDSGINTVNTMWVLIAACLVFIMNLGFATVEAGFTRAKNTANIIMKNLMTPVIAIVVFALVGFTIAFGSDIEGIMGGTEFTGLNGIEIETVWAGSAGLSATVFFLFQVMFAGTAATIVSGAVAERIKFLSYIVFTIMIIAVIYPFVAHWIWGGGWLAKAGFVDFAGSTVVHLVGGTAALVGAMLLGPRIGKYGKNGKPRVLAGHSMPLAAIGLFMLWFGWYGFNAGSELAMDAKVPMIALTTTLAAAFAGVFTMGLTWAKNGKPDLGMSINGILAGLVAITAGCAAVSPMSSMIIGAIAGVVVVYAVPFFDKLKLDDPVGALSVHFACGALGTILVGFFAEAKYGGIDGLLFGGGFGQLGVQLMGVLATFFFVFSASVVAFSAIKAFVGLRVDEHEEVVGLDIGEHGMFAYPDFEIPV